MSRTRYEMIVNHARRLHECIANRGADEFESMSQQIAAHGVGLGGACGYVSQASPTILDWLAANERPDIGVETSEFFSHLEKSFRVLDRSRNFQPVAHDPIVVKKPLYVSYAIAGDLFRLKTNERFPVVLAFIQNGVPTQSRLRALKYQEFEEHSIVMYRNAPFLIVISNGRFSRGPGTTWHNVEAISYREL